MNSSRKRNVNEIQRDKSILLQACRAGLRLRVIHLLSDQCGSTWPELDANLKSKVIILVMSLATLCIHHYPSLKIMPLAQFCLPPNGLRCFTSCFTHTKWFQLTHHIVSWFTRPSPTPNSHQTEDAESTWLPVTATE